MSDQELVKIVEHYMGQAIIPIEYKKAKEYALRKLEFIIEREGDANGERRKSYYLAQLIYETIISNRFSEQIMGIKKELSPQLG